MRYDQMIEGVQERLSVEAERAETILAATVQALGEAADTEEMADLRSQLPGPLSTVAPVEPGRDRSLDETVVRLGDLTGAVDADQARTYLDASFGVVARSVSAGQLQQLMDTLDREYQQLVPGSVGLAGTDETFVGKVRVRAKLDTDEQALRLAATVLSVLSEHISEGQANDLAASLPNTLSQVPDTATAAAHADTDSVLEHIRDRVGLPDKETARGRTHAVAAVIGEWAPEEVSDTLRQLPTDLARLFTA